MLWEYLNQIYRGECHGSQSLGHYFNHCISITSALTDELENFIKMYKGDSKVISEEDEFLLDSKLQADIYEIKLR